MAKITLANGMVIEGTAEELTAMAKAFDSKEEAHGINLYKPVTDREPRVGDFVKWTESDVSYISVNKYYEITEAESGGHFGTLDDDGDSLWRDLDGIPGEKYAIYERTSFADAGLAAHKITAGTPEPAPLKVGDYAKVVKTDKFNVNDIIHIREEDSRHFICDKVGADYWHYADKEGELVHATDEEVAEAKAESRWASIGRKVNEFKKGDIVRIIDSDSVQPNGEVGEIGEFSHNEKFRVLTTTKPTTGNWQGYDTVELITPVEARFDHA